MSKIDWTGQERIVFGAIDISKKIISERISCSKLSNKDLIWYLDLIKGGLTSHDYILEKGPENLQEKYSPSKEKTEEFLQTGLLKIASDFAIKNQLKFPDEFLPSYLKKLEEKENYKRIAEEAKIEKPNLMYRLLFRKLL